MMKQLHIAILLFFFGVSANAQNLQDVLRYSTTGLSGTARYTSMGGAFGALGGDLSALNNNPAGGAVFDYSQFGVSLRTVKNTNTSLYNETKYETNHNDSLFDQIGVTVVFKDEGNLWSKITASFNLQQVSNFNNSFTAQGNSNNGIDAYFLDFAQGNRLDSFELRNGETITDLYKFLTQEGKAGSEEALLGYQSYLISPKTNDIANTEYSSAVAPGSNGYRHKYDIRTYGVVNKYTFNLSGEYLDTFLFGININSHNLRYEENKSFTESNYSNTTSLTLFKFKNDLKTFGRGFSFQIGGIAKINKNIRLGASFESPTWFRIREELDQNVSSDGPNGNVFGETNVNPDVVKVYPAYKFNTPLKYTGSFAYIFGLKGLISIDYTIVDYKSAQFNEPNDSFLTNQNNIISQSLKTAGRTLRVGGEYRFSIYSLRAGYITQEASLINFDNSTEVRSVGAGINFNGGSSLDLSISHAKVNGQQSAFNSGLTDNITLTTGRLDIGLTYSLKF